MKNNVTEFYDQDKLLVRVLSGPMQPGTNFVTEDDKSIQVATMKWDEGHHMVAHKHNTYPRVAYRTNEVFIVIAGRVSATIYNEDGKVVDYVLLGKGDIAMFFAGGHAFDIVDDETEIIEVKNGPFLGVETDKTFFEKK